MEWIRMGMEQRENLDLEEVMGGMDLLQEQRGGEAWAGGGAGEGGGGNVAWITNRNGLEGKADPGNGGTGITYK